jgi:DNA-binding transcriptional regulator YiaG
MKAKEIAKLRERLGLTQQELAEMLGVHQTAVSHWETGRPISSMARKALERLQQEAA